MPRLAIGRWLGVRFAAFGLRHGISSADISKAIGQAFPHRDAAWRAELLADAWARSDRGATE